MAEIKYYIVQEGQYVESDATNGYVPGLSWIDSNGNEFKAIITGILSASFEMKLCEYQYKKYIKPVGLDWIDKEVEIVNVSINNSNYVNMMTGELIVDPYELIPEIPVEDVTEENPQTYHERWTEYPAAMHQGDYFIFLACKNVPDVAFGLFPMMLGEVIRRENLTV